MWIRTNTRPNREGIWQRGSRKIFRCRESNSARSGASHRGRIDTHADIAATLLYPGHGPPVSRDSTTWSRGWSAARRNEVIDVALRSRTKRDELLRGFRGGLYAFDIVMDIGAYRDLHRHRRCQQFRQAYSGRLGIRHAAGACRGRIGIHVRCADDGNLFGDGENGGNVPRIT